MADLDTMKIAVHQPNFLPYLGFFDKARQVDTFVILDDVQFTKRGFTNRNKVKKPNGTIWLTVPLTGDKLLPINQIHIADHVDWKTSHLKTLKHMYGKAEFYEEIYPKIEEVYDKSWTLLADFNLALLNVCFSSLGIDCKLEFSSTLEITAEDASERIIRICEKLKASHYLSGQTGRDYLDESDYQDHGIELSFHGFKHPVYPQQFGEFIPNLSIIDYLMNVGSKAFW